LLVWSVPIVAGNVIGGWPTVRFFLARLQGVGTPLSAAGLPARLAKRWWQFQFVETGFEYGYMLSGHIWPSSVPESLLWAPSRLMRWVVSLELAVLLYAFSSRGERLRDGAKRLAVPLLIIAAHLLASVFGPTALLSAHLYPVLPLFYLAAAALPSLWPNSRFGRLAWVAPVALLAASAFQAPAVLADVREGLDATGGCGVESSSTVVDLARWLETRPEDHPINLQTRDFRSSLLYFSAGLVDPSVVGWNKRVRDFADPQRLLELAGSDRHALLLVAHCHQPCAYPEQVGQDTLPALQRLADRAKAKLSLVRSFRSRDGQPTFEAYRLSWPSRR
jgi:hypothetical protein